ncbi:hypothetical protein [Pseudomonas canadensis]|uniref:hypothetical protein n=1 Tax=Pseudomonas canadensis TaxID=915099 RepID=UPI003B9E4140
MVQDGKLLLGGQALVLLGLLLKRTLIVSKALDDALKVLGERHDFDEWQETISTFLINLAAAPDEESARFVSMSRPDFEITEKQSRQLEEFRKTGIAS